MKSREPACANCYFWKARTPTAGTCWVDGDEASLTLENQHCDRHRYRTIIVTKPVEAEPELRGLPFE